MSVRIYQLSKDLGITNKELLQLLQDKGLDVSSPSNTIPNIYADALMQDLKKPLQLDTAPAVDESEAPKVAAQRTPAIPEAVKEIPLNSAPKVSTEASTVIAAESIKPVMSPKPGPSIPAAIKKSFITATKPSIPLTVDKPIHVSEVTTAPVEKNISTLHAPNPLEIPVVVAPIDSKPSVVISTPLVPTISSTSPKLPPRIPQRPGVPPRPAPISIAFTNIASDPHNQILAAANEVNVSTIPAVSTAQIPGDLKGLKSVQTKLPIVLRDLATLIDLKPFRLISELMEMGIFASMNQIVEEEIAIQISKRHGYNLEIRHRRESTPAAPIVKTVAAAAVKPQAIPLELEPRPPVVCVLGHVDHGKTTLLDNIRKANVAAGEAGGITQHIGAYQIEVKGHKMTFLDTPGHAAFSKMRERGANSTDIAILVVAADDGFMPQTDEALKFAQKAHLPVVVAINKMDAKGANIDRVKQQMQQRGIMSEDWGGEVLCSPVSAIKGDNMDALLDLVLLQAEIMELKAPVKCPAGGIVIESQIELGRGSTATVIVQKGILKIGDALVCGGHTCKVKAMMDEKGQSLKEARPSTPVRVIGWSGTVDAGSLFEVCKNEKEAKNQASENLVHALQASQEATRPVHSKAATVEDLFAAIATTKDKVLKVIVKGDVNGSVEALVGALEGIHSTKVKLEVVDGQVGLISKNDITLGNMAEAIVIGFNVKLEAGAQQLAKHHNVRIIQHGIIYELVDQIKLAMAELLEPDLKENKLGVAQVRQIFSLSKESVAGCMVIEGKINRDALARIVRSKKTVHESRISTLKRFKEDASEVKAGYECGIIMKNFQDYQVGDSIECFEIIKIPATL